MSDKVYKMLELVGCSGEGVEAAVSAAIAKAAETVHALSWFEIKEVRGAIRDGKPVEWQVSLNAGFKVD